ncbi:Uncharacterised protein [Mycobacteroides abscessus subsp. abscessus]|nr:Uncharacterised protein [Mycobacteroides abscessus subsp. abscessus]SIH62621.1 Uncharacterised protein [Mycobacteroides abscessus subsp. abscessus]SIM66593.1 Uncharacterised protein [Mycobacteroides abscessus subsp. abscessus]
MTWTAPFPHPGVHTPPTHAVFKCTAFDESQRAAAELYPPTGAVQPVGG